MLLVIKTIFVTKTILQMTTPITGIRITDNPN